MLGSPSLRRVASSPLQLLSACRAVFSNGVPIPPGLSAALVAKLQQQYLGGPVLANGDPHRNAQYQGSAQQHEQGSQSAGGNSSNMTAYQLTLTLQALCMAGAEVPPPLRAALALQVESCLTSATPLEALHLVNATMALLGKVGFRHCNEQDYGTAGQGTI
jgi:hypothetical protein